jgi:taurine dioxygenase
MLKAETGREALRSARPVQDVEVFPWPAVLGAEVRCGDVRTLTDDAMKQVYQAWLDNLVVVFRDQALSDDDMLAFARRFGENHEAAPPHMMPVGMKARHNPYIGIISNVMENGVPIGSLGFGEAVWHTDHSYKEEPLKASLLYAHEVPEAGGETGFANMYLALETLPDDLRRRIEGRTIKNDMTYNSAGQIRRGFSAPKDVVSAPGPSHPIVRTHPETGHNALYLGRRPNAYVNGLPVEESEALLDALWRHATQVQLTWHHKWRVGDVLIWDNRCAMHHRNAFAPDARRVMHRTTVKGTRPYFSPDASRLPPHPRGHLKVHARS